MAVVEPKIKAINPDTRHRGLIFIKITMDALHNLDKEFFVLHLFNTRWPLRPVNFVADLFLRCRVEFRLHKYFCKWTTIEIES